MKATNSTSGWCLNTEMGLMGQKWEQGMKVTTSVMSVKTHKCVPCHLTLNLDRAQTEDIIVDAVCIEVEFGIIVLR